MARIPLRTASWATDPDILRAVDSIAGQLDPALAARIASRDPEAILHVFNQINRSPGSGLPASIAGERVAAAGPGPGQRFRFGRTAAEGDPATGASIVSGDGPVVVGDFGSSTVVDDSLLQRIAGEATPSPYVSGSFPPSEPINVGAGPGGLGSTSMVGGGPSGSVLDFATAEDFAPSRYPGNANEYRIRPTRPFVQRTTADAPSGRAQRLLDDMPPDAAVDEFGVAVDPNLSSVSTTDIDLPPGSMRDIYPRPTVADEAARSVDDVPEPAPRPDDTTDADSDDPGTRQTVEPEIDWQEVSPWQPRPAAEAFGWTRADGTPGLTQQTAQFLARNAWPIGLLAGGTLLNYGRVAMNDASGSALPAPPGFEPLPQATTPDAPVVDEEPVVPPPQETVDQVPLESLEGAPEFDVGTPDLGQPPVELLGAMMAAGDTFLPEEPETDPQEEEFVPGSPLAGMERAQAIMSLRRELADGSITPEDAMRNPLYARIPEATLRRLVAKGANQAERRDRLQALNRFGAVVPRSQAAALAAAYQTLAPEDRPAFMAQFTLGGPPGQFTRSMDARLARESTERVRGQELASEEAQARIQARGSVGSAAMTSFGQLGAGYYQATAAMQAARAQNARIQAEMEAARLRHQEAMRAGDLRAAEQARRDEAVLLQAQRQADAAMATLDLERQKFEREAQQPLAQRQADALLVDPRYAVPLRTAAQRAYSRGRTREQARVDVTNASPGLPPGVYELVLNERYGPVAAN